MMDAEYGKLNDNEIITRIRQNDDEAMEYMLKKYDDVRIVVLDLLTYAGYLGTIADDIDGDRCQFVKGDICDRRLLEDLFATHRFDVVVNFAAESHVDRSIENPQIFLQTNILGTQALLDVARQAWQTGKDAAGYPVYRAGVRYHQVSTDEVYGSLGAEGYFTEETPLNPHSPYSASKTSADHFVCAYHDTFHMPVSITRCSNNYGPYQFPEKLIPLMINNVKHHKQLPVYGDGMQIRDWLYVEDHCKAIDMVCNGGKIGEVYNVGGHNERQNIQIIHIILDTLQEMLDDSDPRKALVSEKLIKYVTDRKGHDRRYAIDPTKIETELGWKPQYTFDTGIAMTIQWYLDNQDWWKHILSGEYSNYFDKMYGNRLQ